MSIAKHLPSLFSSLWQVESCHLLVSAGNHVKSLTERLPFVLMKPLYLHLSALCLIECLQLQATPVSYTAPDNGPSALEGERH